MIGKAVGTNFLCFPVVNGGEWIMRYLRYLCLPIQLLELCFDNFQRACLFHKTPINRVTITRC
jgi:hypothetical protein